MKTRACLPLVALLVGCGGNVIVDPTTATPIEPVDLACADMCSAVEAACPAQAQGCSASCTVLDKVGHDACSESYQPFLTCVVDNAATSVFCGGQSCAGEANAFTACLASACQTNPSSCTP